MCNTPAPSLLGSIIRSTSEESVYAGEAECNASRLGDDRGFGYVGHLIHPLPPVNRWGKTFITDFGHLYGNQTPYTQELVALLYIVSAETAEEASVEITTYIPGEWTPTNSSNYVLEPYQPMTIEVSEDTSAHVIVQSSSQVLVVYEVVNKVTGEHYFSSLLQAAEWYTNQQSLLLSRSLVSPQSQQYYYITIVVKTELESHDLINLQIQTANHKQPTSLQDYTPIKMGNITSNPVGASGYTIVTVAVDSEALGANDTYAVIKSVNACIEFGATITSYGEHFSYAHTNAYVLGE